MRLSTVQARDDVRLTVAQIGDPDRPGVLFIHGFGESCLSFEPQFESELATRYHLVSFDLRGHGSSDKPSGASAYLEADPWAGDVEAVMRATGLRRPVVCAWSYGAFVALDYIRRKGAAPWAGLAIVGSSGGLLGAPTQSEVSPDILAARAESDRLLMSLSAADNAKGALLVAERTALPEDTAKQRALLVATQLMMPGRVRQAMAQRNLDNSDLLPAVDLPVLLMAGDQDPAISPADSARLAQALPSASLISYPRTGHRPFAQRPQGFNADLATFVEAVAQPRRGMADD